MNILRTKIAILPIRASLLVMFLFVSMKSSILVLSSASDNNNELHRKDAVEIARKNSCNLMDNSCCCGQTAHKTNDCYCRSPALGKNSGELAVKTSENKLFNAIISSIKCSNIPVDFQIGSLSDYDPSSLYAFSSLLKKAGSLTNLQENHIVEPHLFLLFKPPRNIS